jgi:hypothetical protein
MQQQSSIPLEVLAPRAATYDLDVLDVCTIEDLALARNSWIHGTNGHFGPPRVVIGTWSLRAFINVRGVRVYTVDIDKPTLASKFRGDTTRAAQYCALLNDCFLRALRPYLYRSPSALVFTDKIVEAAFTRCPALTEHVELLRAALMDAALIAPKEIKRQTRIRQGHFAEAFQHLQEQLDGATKMRTQIAASITAARAETDERFTALEAEMKSRLVALEEIVDENTKSIKALIHLIKGGCPDVDTIRNIQELQNSSGQNG